MSENHLEHPLPVSTARSVIQGLREGVFLVALASIAFLVLALLSYHPDDPGHFSTNAHSDGKVANLAGSVGAGIAQSLLQVLGYLAWAIPMLIALPLVYRLLGYRWHFHLLTMGWRAFGFLLFLLSACSLAHLHLSGSSLPAGSGGGIIGLYLGAYLVNLLGEIGVNLILGAVLMTALSLVSGLPWVVILEGLGRLLFFLLNCSVFLAQKAWLILQKSYHQQKATWIKIRKRWVWKKQQSVRKPSKNAQDRGTEKLKKAGQKREEERKTAGPPGSVAGSDNPDTLAVAEDESDNPDTLAVAEDESDNLDIVDLEEEASEAEEAEKVPQFKIKLPEVGLLTAAKDSDKNDYSVEELADIAELLEQKLLDFGVKAKIVEAAPGPVVTRFELQPDTGVKASKITGLAKDLARSLAVHSLRVIEVIPGKTCVGIEVPNANREIVRLVQIIDSEEYKATDSGLVLALGKDIAGRPVCADLAKMPHLLMAGTTGSGKSVGVNAMLLSILFKSSPAQVRLILVDPKMLELSVYEDIPHLLTPVITDMSKAANALRWCIYEMERRYRLMSATGVRNVAGFNQKVKEAVKRGEPIRDLSLKDEDEILDPLPLIVVVIDEFADMIMVVGKKVEELIARLAQKARAAGIHLVLATQRPSVDVITGLIKANIPGRISFQVNSKIDSRVVLDQGGAEQLLGHGDMLFMPPGTSSTVRIHGAFVDDDEVHRVAENWRKQGAPEYIEQILAEASSSPASGGGSDANEEQDELYEEVVAYIIESRRPTISSVQRKFRIGYNRAARLLESLEINGVVSAMDSAGNREILALEGEDS